MAGRKLGGTNSQYKAGGKIEYPLGITVTKEQHEWISTCGLSKSEKIRRMISIEMEKENSLNLAKTD